MSGVQLVSASSDTDVSDDVVVRIPANPRHLRIVRMVAATFASDAGYSIDDVDDVRMAADEVCAAVMESAVRGAVTVTLRSRAGRLTMTAEGLSDDDTAHPPELDELRAAILGAVTDEFGASASDGRVAVTFTKAGAATS